ncbi:hypothetical protein X975_01265, partial [Stegodyphus mimosarum]
RNTYRETCFSFYALLVLTSCGFYSSRNWPGVKPLSNHILGY